MKSCAYSISFWKIHSILPAQTLLASIFQSCLEHIFPNSFPSIAVISYFPHLFNLFQIVFSLNCGMSPSKTSGQLVHLKKKCCLLGNAQNLTFLLQETFMPYDSACPWILLFSYGSLLTSLHKDDLFSPHEPMEWNGACHKALKYRNHISTLM